MRYLIITKDKKPFYTQWFDCENNYNPAVIECVFDFNKGLHSFDGQHWINTEIDSL